MLSDFNYNFVFVVEDIFELTIFYKMLMFRHFEKIRTDSGVNSQRIFSTNTEV